VRIVSNPAFSREALEVAGALALLERSLVHPGHLRWSDDLGVVEVVGPSVARLQGHRQLTDVYLLNLAARRKGVLATFDAGLRAMAAGGAMGALEVVAGAARKPGRP
jgi:predicted nucleic acid-binding protein